MRDFLLRSTLAIKLVLTLFLIMSCSVFAGDDNDLKIKPYLYKYEPNYLGFTHDNDASDKLFLDFKVSIMTPFFRDLFNQKTRFSNTFIAVTIRGGQYLGRESAPVIGKAFNPKIFYRRWFDSNKNENSGYIDFGYVHESNGQSIHTQSQFDQKVTSEGDRDKAYDYVSRGWDYLQFIIKGTEVVDDGNYAFYGDFKQFLDYGLFQKKAENYFPWEQGDDLKKRNRVNGMKIISKKIHTKSFNLLNTRTSDFKTALIYETGIGSPFEYHTIRLEETFKIFEIPMMIWYQDGYSNDLARYYKKTSSYGIAYEIGGI